uniref:Uncharacterized protein n=1 Tax=Aegilops tauschii subsp. strangulata TaxID=200361 RepID=A0A452XNA4_AEGTS
MMPDFKVNLWSANEHRTQDKTCPLDASEISSWYQCCKW